MTLEEAGRTLRQMYKTAPNKEKAAYIHLFGIMYDSELGDLTNTDIVRAAGIRPSYHSEVAKGRRLAKFVRPKGMTTLAKPVSPMPFWNRAEQGPWMR